MNEPSDDDFDPLDRASSELSEHGGDGFSPDNTASPGAKRISVAQNNNLKKRWQKVQKQASRNHIRPLAVDPEKQLTTQPLRLMSSNETPNVNVWLDSVSGLSVKPRQEVKAADLSLVHSKLLPLRQFPDVPGRWYKYSIDSFDAGVTWDPSPEDSHTYKDYGKKGGEPKLREWHKTIKTWRIHVWNDALSDSQQVRLWLFPELEIVLTRTSQSWESRRKMHAAGKARAKPEPFDNLYKYWVTGGPLDISICPTEVEVANVAE